MTWQNFFCFIRAVPGRPVKVPAISLQAVGADGSSGEAATLTEFLKGLLMLQLLPLVIHFWLGNWWAFGFLFILTGFVFAVMVPRAKARIFVAVTTNLPRRVLDEYMMTWRASDAERFFREIGPEGREAYRVFYRRTDFWFPGLVISLLYVSFVSLAFPPGSKFAWIVIFGFAGWLFDLAENINHYRMSSSYPQLGRSALAVGPLFTLTKWLVAVIFPLIGVTGFIARLV